MSWTPGQRAVLIAFIAVLCLVLVVRLRFNDSYVPNPPPPQGARHALLIDRIDPNVATWQELAVVPQLGESRAKAIVAYRDEFAARGKPAPAFATENDLLNVRGIGVAMLATIRPHLRFPSTFPATR